jgi:hypothetical protein
LKFYDEDIMGKPGMIMKIQNHEQREVEIRKYAISLGCSLYDIYTGDGKHLEYEVEGKGSGT